MTNLNEVLAFCQTATQTERAQILGALTPGASRQVKAGATLGQIHNGEIVSFPYDSVQYKARVEKINQTTATVVITEINGTPRRSISVGTKIRVGASILARS
jgi:hypothetical protein